jgi:uroporphyrinogen-III synthase
MAGKRIVNTRAAHQAAELDVLLRERGAEPLPYPCIAIVPPAQTDELDRALREAAMGAFDWIILTSANTVLSLAQRLDSMSLALHSTRLHVAVVGSSTAQAAKEHLGLDIDVLPDEFTSESLAASFKNAYGLRILLPVSYISRPNLAEALRASGASVTRLVAYRTISGSGGVEISSLLARRQVDAIVFTSTSTVTYFMQRLTAEGGNRDNLGEICIASIGPQTAQTAQECGMHVSITATVHTVEGLVAGLESYFENVRTGAN